MNQKLIALSLFVASTLLFPLSVHAQSTSYWSQCSEGVSIVRCETFNCPKGDTNKDGRCTSTDENAQITEARNDSFCANPPSGCGEVLYYAQKDQNSCAVRVKENTNNCDLYKAGNPSFATKTQAPISTPSPTPVSRLTVSTATPTAKPTTNTGKESLPKTGAALWVSLALAGMGLYGLYLYENPRKEQ